MKIILIGGASGSGKSTLAQMLLTRMQSERLSVLHLSMDDYFVEVPEHVTDIEHFRRTENFDQIEKYDLGNSTLKNLLLDRLCIQGVLQNHKF